MPQSCSRLRGSSPVVGSSRKSSRGRSIMPDGQVETALHPAGVGPGPAIGGLDEIELGAAARAVRARGGAAGQPEELRHHVEVLPPGQHLVDRGELAGEADRALDPHRVGEQVVPGDGRACPRRGGAGWRGCGPSSSCPRRWDRAAPAPTRPRWRGRRRRARGGRRRTWGCRRHQLCMSYTKLYTAYTVRVKGASRPMTRGSPGRRADRAAAARARPALGSAGAGHAAAPSRGSRSRRSSKRRSSWPTPRARQRSRWRGSPSRAGLHHDVALPLRHQQGRAAAADVERERPGCGGASVSRATAGARGCASGRSSSAR